jgi:Fe-Mn family superoxide dismutase
MNRRTFLKTTALATGALVLSQAEQAARAAAPWLRGEAIPDDFPHTQLPLPYAFTALEPHLEGRIMELHYTKHHAAYVAKLKALLDTRPDLAAQSLEALLAQVGTFPLDVKTVIRNHGGGHWNHTFFWRCMRPAAEPAVAPSAGLQTALEGTFGSVEGFKAQFTEAAKSVFGSGWAWLVKAPDGKLTLTTTPNQDNPLMDLAEQRGKPLLGLDVWEHAYYLQYQNRRPDYVGGWWPVVNWAYVNQRFG